MAELAGLGHWHFWDGRTADPALAAFLAVRPGVIWWVESPLFSDGDWLMITYEATEDHPLRVPPRRWLKWEPSAAAFCWFEGGPLDD